jgi:branched-chain amino acid transport system substrate-binding protein
MIKPIKVGALVVAGALALAACGGGSETAEGGETAAPAGKTLVISTDLPLQGSSADASSSTNNAIKLYLEQIGYKVGDYTIELKEYDNSTAAKGGWDDAQCAKNAQDHVANAAEIAVMGTYNSGCAKIILPVLNQDPNGPMLMVSHANTNPGLTKTWDPGEPDIFYPTGTRNYARIITTDDYQGQAAAQYLKAEKGATKCAVLNDNQTYGQGVAKAFEAEAVAQGIEVVLSEAWDAKQSNYTALFEKIKGLGADCVYIGGIFDNNGGQLIKDKTAVLGDNSAFLTMAPDGFTGYPDLQAMPEAEGLLLSFTGISQAGIIAAGGTGAKFVSDYEAKYGEKPVGSFSIYGAGAVQVILAAIEKAAAAGEVTRATVNAAVLSGDGITIPQADSVTGSELAIDPATGDMKSRTITIQQMLSGAETDVMPWVIK